MGPLACAVNPGLAMQVGKCRGVWQRWATCGGRRQDVTSAQTAGVPSIKNSMVLGKCFVCVCVEGWRVMWSCGGWNGCWGPQVETRTGSEGGQSRQCGHTRLQGLVSGTRVVAVASYRYTHRGEEVERDSVD